jgi:superfamily II DNA helicase RecQ
MRRLLPMVLLLAACSVNAPSEPETSASDEPETSASDEPETSASHEQIHGWPHTGENEAGLYSWGNGCAGTDGVPAYVVADNKTLAAIAVRRPSDAAGLLAVPGIGQRKAAGYGDEILAIVSST